MAYRFERLKVWGDARQFVTFVYQLTANFPGRERFALTDQLCRAAISIVLNIAEGSEKKSDVDFVRFLRIATGSLNEVVAGLYIALDLAYISKETFDDLYQKANILSSRLNALIRTIKLSGSSKR